MFHPVTTKDYIAVIVLDGFSTLSLGSIVEPFSYLSKAFPEIAPRLILAGLGGRSARSQSGVCIECDEDVEALRGRLQNGRKPSSLIICGNNDADLVEKGRLLSVLRLSDRHAVPIYSLGSGTLLLAEAGLLKGGKGTVHWKYLAAFAERYHDLDAQDALFVSNGMVTSCAGELATLDMVLDIIGSISTRAAAATANQLLISFPRRGNTNQPGSQGYRLRDVPSDVTAAARVMAHNIEEPLLAAEIAGKCGISVRKLERLFRQNLNASPMQYYTRVRLEQAHDLLMQTNMSALDVAVATGFGSAGALTKKFKRKYGETPKQLRESALRVGVVDVF